MAHHYFPWKIITLRKKRKLAALSKQVCEEHPKKNLAGNSNVSRSQEDYISSRRMSRTDGGS